MRSIFVLIIIITLCIPTALTSVEQKPLSVYLAGPDVFYPNAIIRGDAKKALVQQAGYRAYFPMDNAIPSFQHNVETALAIAQANEEMMDQCQVILVNMRPWHGPSMDVGTAFEVGYMRARAVQNPPSTLIIGYTSDSRSFVERVSADYYDGAVTQEEGGNIVGKDGVVLEHFAMRENLMIEHAITKTGGKIFTSFEEAVQHIAPLWEQKGVRL